MVRLLSEKKIGDLVVEKESKADQVHIKVLVPGEKRMVLAEVWWMYMEGVVQVTLFPEIGGKRLIFNGLDAWKEMVNAVNQALSEVPQERQ